MAYSYDSWELLFFSSRFPLQTGAKAQPSFSLFSRFACLIGSVSSRSVSSKRLVKKRLVKLSRSFNFHRDGVLMDLGGCVWPLPSRISSWGAMTDLRRLVEGRGYLRRVAYGVAASESAAYETKTFQSDGKASDGLEICGVRKGEGD